MCIRDRSRQSLLETYEQRQSFITVAEEDGKIIERGDHEDLIQMKGIYYQLYTCLLYTSKTSGHSICLLRRSENAGRNRVADADGKDVGSIEAAQ